MPEFRNFLYETERDTFSKYAAFSSNSKGRLRFEEECAYRSVYQRDRDRIIHSKAFRRLSHKTQVFISPEGDHYRTRLTHTLEVMQIARTIARALRLNEDLCEAISMGHDLGHTPFGHSGEEVLAQCSGTSFTHYKQSLRVVDLLENGGRGLNLSFEVRDGIVNHTGQNMASTLEGIIVKYADRIAYINHDIDDAIRAGILTESDIPSEISSVLGYSCRDRINSMVSSMVRASYDRDRISMEDEIGEAMNELREFMFRNVYLNPLAKKEEKKAKELVLDLYRYFESHPEQMPQEYQQSSDAIPVRVCDYISGMTDRYAVAVYEKLHIPEKFRAL